MPGLVCGPLCLPIAERLEQFVLFICEASETMLPAAQVDLEKLALQGCLFHGARVRPNI